MVSNNIPSLENKLMINNVKFVLFETEDDLKLDSKIYVDSKNTEDKININDYFLISVDNNISAHKFRDYLNNIVNFNNSYNNVLKFVSISENLTSSNSEVDSSQYGFMIPNWDVNSFLIKEFISKFHQRINGVYRTSSKQFDLDFDFLGYSIKNI